MCELWVSGRTLLIWPSLSSGRPASQDEWLDLLSQQQVLHQQEMQKWQEVLTASISLMEHMKSSLVDLQRSIDLRSEFLSRSKAPPADSPKTWLTDGSCRPRSLWVKIRGWRVVSVRLTSTIAIPPWMYSFCCHSDASTIKDLELISSHYSCHKVVLIVSLVYGWTSRSDFVCAFCAQQVESCSEMMVYVCADSVLILIPRRVMMINSMEWLPAFFTCILWNLTFAQLIHS